MIRTTTGGHAHFPHGGCALSKELLPDELREEIEPLLPPAPPPSSKGGRPPAGHRQALRGIIFVLRTGLPWQMLPADVFGVSGSTCWRRMTRWARLGVWPAVHRRLLNRLGKLGGVDLSAAAVDAQSVRAALGGAHTGPNPTDRGKAGCKRHVITDAAGVPLVVHTTAANVNDETAVPAMLDALPPVQGPRGRPKAKPAALYGDRAYGVAWLIAFVLARRIRSRLAPRADQTHGSGLGKVRYVVERTLACFSHFRRIRLCYERQGEHFQAFHDLAASLLVATRLKRYRPCQV